MKEKLNDDEDELVDEEEDFEQLKLIIAELKLLPKR